MAIARLLLLTLASSVVLLGLAVACRWMARTSRWLAAIVAIGIAARLVVGLSLIVVPYLKTPPPERAGIDASWNIAPDARGYYTAARQAAVDGLDTLPERTPSIMYVRLLALWFMAFGANPLSPLLMNLTCYVLTSVIVVSTLRRLPARLLHLCAGATLAAFAVSPMLIYVSTQPLKDPLFILLAVLVAAGAWAVAAAIMSLPTWPRGRTALSLGAIIVAIYLIAGVRIYYSLLLCGCLAVLFAASLMTRHRMRASLVLATAALTLVGGMTAFLLGSEGKGETLARALANSDGPRTQIDSAREAFIVSGGSTNMAADEKPALDRSREAAVELAKQQAEDPSTPLPTGTAGVPAFTIEPPAADDGRTSSSELRIWVLPASDKGWRRYVREASTGLGAMFIPMTLLRSLSLVEVGGGSAQLAFADIDTLFLDTTLIGMLALLLWKGRGATLVWAYVVFSLALGILLAVLMGYVVTNFGTLVRLRLMLTVPFWTLPFAFRHLESGEAMSPLGPRDQHEQLPHQIGAAIAAGRELAP